MEYVRVLRLTTLLVTENNIRKMSDLPSGHRLRHGNHTKGDKNYRPLVGDPTAADLRTLKELGGFTITDMVGIMLLPRRTIERCLAGKAAFSSSSFKRLETALFVLLANDSSARIKECGGRFWWRKDIHLSIGPDGRKYMWFQ